LKHPDLMLPLHTHALILNFTGIQMQRNKQTEIALSTRVDFINGGRASECSPVTTLLVVCLGDGKVLDLVWAGHELNEQSFRVVPGNVTVERPYTNVAGLVLHNHSPLCTNPVSITSGGVRWVSDCAIPRQTSLVSE